MIKKGSKKSQRKRTKPVKKKGEKSQKKVKRSLQEKGAVKRKREVQMKPRHEEKKKSVSVKTKKPFIDRKKKAASVETTTEEGSSAKQAGAGSRIRIKVSAYDHKMIDTSVERIISKVESSGAYVMGPVPLPTKKKVFTVDKSTFIHKDSRDQFFLKVHRRLIDILNPSQNTVDSLMSLNLPSGVDVEIKM